MFASIQDQMIQEGLHAAMQKDWNTFEKIATYDAYVGAFLLSSLDSQLPPELKWNIAVEHYCNNGDNYPSIRRILKASAKCKPESWRDSLPESVRDLTAFTVYRAGGEELGKANYSMSWTLSRDVAEWFAKRHRITHNWPQHLYKGVIPAEKVIAYIGDRSEFEIVQYRSVKQIEEISFQGISEEFQSLCGLSVISPDAAIENNQKRLEYFNKWIRNEVVAK